MKLTLSRYLVENVGDSPNIAPIRRNLESCIKRSVFIFRGSDTAGTFGEKEARETRNSLTNSNFILNFTSLFFEHLPSRKRSYFGTNSPSNASDFGSLFVIVPHDSVSKVAIIPNDFNLQDNPVLNKIRTGWNLSGLGFQLHIGILNIDEELNTPESKRLKAISSKIANTTDVDKQDFAEFDEAFRALFESGQPQRWLEGEDNYDAKYVQFVWETVSEKYNSTFSSFLRAAINAGHQGVEVLSFDEALKKMGTDEVFEIWFEGKCSFFSLNWLDEKYTEITEDEDGIIDSANEEQDIHDAVGLVLSSFLR